MAVQVDPLPPASLEDVLSAPAPAGRDIVVLIDRASDPRNIGAVMRSAAAFGARAVLLPARHSPENTPALAKAASGALDRIPPDPGAEPEPGDDLVEIPRLLDRRPGR